MYRLSLQKKRQGQNRTENQNQESLKRNHQMTSKGPSLKAQRRVSQPPDPDWGVLSFSGFHLLKEAELLKGKMLQSSFLHIISNATWWNGLLFNRFTYAKRYFLSIRNYGWLWTISSKCWLILNNKLKFT